LNVFTLKQLFSPTLRRDTLVASALAFVALLGVWGGTMWIPAAIREISAHGTVGLGAVETQRYLASRASYAMMLVNAGAMFGNALFGPVADWKGRRPAFLIFFVGGIALFPITFLMTSNLAVIVFALAYSRLLCSRSDERLSNLFARALPDLRADDWRRFLL